MGIRESFDRTINFLHLRSRAYKLCFGSPVGNEVLIDLAKFCRAAETCVIPGDSDRTLVLEGRREVWIRITQHLHLTDEQLYALYSGKNILQPATGDDDA